MLGETYYELTEGEYVELTNFIVSCGHEGVVTLNEVPSDNAKASLESNTLYALDTGLATIEGAVTLPDGFGSCFSLSVNIHSRKNMTLPAMLTEIREKAFINTAAEEYILPEGMSTIGSHAFADSQVKLATIQTSVESIAENAFEGCDIAFIVSSGS